MKRDEGFVLIASLLIMVVVVVLVFGTSFTALVDRMISSNQRGANAAYYVAQAGLQQYKTLIFKNLVDYYDEYGETWCANPIGAAILDEHGDPYLPAGGTNGPYPFGPGAYSVTYQVSDTFMVLTSVGVVGNSQTAIQLVSTAGMGPAGVYDNAIFAAGRSPGTKAITGNIAVYGSMHIVSGSVELDGDEGDLEFSGTAGVYNNYLGNNEQSNSRIVEELEDVTGTGTADLCARLKIDRGNVFLQGNSRLGAEGNPIYSVHLGDGSVYDGNEPREEDEITAHKDSDKVWLKYPAEGDYVNSGYDGYDLALPRLDKEYPDELADALDLAGEQGNQECQWLFQDDKVTLPPEDPSASHPECTNGTSGISWIGGNPGHFKIDGVVNTGELSLKIGDSQNDTIRYEGMGILRAGKSRNDSSVTTTLTGSIKPIEGVHGHGGYPEDNVLAIITSGDAAIKATAGGDDSEIAAIIYTGGTVSIERQPLVIGSLVANDFDMGAGNNVPKVAWHPGIREAAEILCLPGSFCDQGEVPPNPGMLTNISIERRDTAAID